MTDDTLRYGPAPVRPEWIDYNGHMNVAYYVMAFDEALEHFYRGIGLDEDYRRANRSSTMTLEMHVNYLREIMEGESFVIDTLVLGVDAKRLHLFHTMRHAETGDALATSENMLIHVSLTARRSTPFPDELRKPLEALARRHAKTERPAQAGRSIGLPDRTPANGR